METYIGKQGLELKKKVSTVLLHECKPELDVSAQCKEQEEVSQHHQRILVGVLRWTAELGRVDICTEVSMMAAHCTMPRKGHIEAEWHMVAYLKKHDRSRMVFSSSPPDLDVKTSALPRRD